MNLPLEEIRKQKALLRKRALALRHAQPNKDALSRIICAKLVSLAEFQSARTILFYVHYGSEVRTQPLLVEMLRTDQQVRVLVPYCRGNDLHLFRLESMDELSPGHFGILEPRPELRSLREKQAVVEEVDLVVVPGVAFDRRGGRLGHGRGYYDRLLARARPEAVRVGLAYECQIFPEVPMLPTDVAMDRVITESAVYPETFAS